MGDPDITTSLAQVISGFFVAKEIFLVIGTNVLASKKASKDLKKVKEYLTPEEFKKTCIDYWWPSFNFKSLKKEKRKTKKALYAAYNFCYAILKPFSMPYYMVGKSVACLENYINNPIRPDETETKVDILFRRDTINTIEKMLLSDYQSPDTLRESNI